ncbi:hypothetical protein M422DRAFT_143954, partial [Sphaerobolus stellatus SS14]
LKNFLCRLYCDGKLLWNPKDQLVYPLDDTRAEFIVITVPYLCSSYPYDHRGFRDFHSRMGWKFNRHDRNCHDGACPAAGMCTRDLKNGADWYGLAIPSISKIDGSTYLTNMKVGFLQDLPFF